jgi:two-component system nitrogen regulation sensor histidine kinase NtrY
MTSANNSANDKAQKSQNSLERYLWIRLSLFVLPMVLLLTYLGWDRQLPLFWLILGNISFIALYSWLIVGIKGRVMRSFTRATLHVEALQQEDYNQFAKSTFPAGEVFEFHHKLKKLSEQLQAQKSQYDQHVYLVYQLISQLDTPVLVFNEKQQLTLGNDAFIALFKQPWQMFRHASAQLLGLAYSEQGTEQYSEKNPEKRNNHHWKFIDIEQQSKWQIRHSEFLDDGETHQLLIFLNIEPALRQSQLKAWQQIIRVLGHEIRNSLTPVSSMAETLLDKTENTRDKMVLEVITERCLHLQSFVNRYGSISQTLQLNSRWLKVRRLISSVSSLFESLEIITDISVEEIWADGELLEQVLINLFKNAKEAHATKLTISINFARDGKESYYQLNIIDNGQGFANLDNLFVPLYTTKLEGQGIGLSFCRNIIEQHQGEISLKNNAEQGVNVVISLPVVVR